VGKLIFRGVLKLLKGNSLRRKNMADLDKTKNNIGVDKLDYKTRKQLFDNFKDAAARFCQKDRSAATSP
jgi:hypothetical protein